MTLRIRAALAVPLLLASTGRADDFFEKRVRPVLAEHCFKCHSEKQQKGSVRLDGPKHLAAPADGGAPLVVPGKPDESRLVKAVAHAEGVEAMPPGKTLPADSVEAIVQWVKAGAVWPGDIKTGPAADHWAFKPVAAPPVPEVKRGDWPADDIDRFVLAKLEAKGLTPAPAADRPALARRLHFDLTGLPPTAEQVEAFVADKSPDAVAKVVDALLASPAFGERWGRHWLDVARYSDTSGAAVNEDVRYPFAYSYRDWVVKALNADRPYNEFLIAQIAADKLNPAEGHPDHAALGFLTLGRKFQGNDQSVIDDRLDAVFRGTQGLTVSCARCHDHKFDPIPIRDYYSLYGVFSGAREEHSPIIATPADRTKHLTYTAELRSRVRGFEKFKEDSRRRVVGPANQEAQRYLLAAASGAEVKVGEDRKREDGLDDEVCQKYRDRLQGAAEDHDAVFAPWVAFAKLDAGKFAAEGGPLARKFAENDEEGKLLNPLVAKLFAGKPPANLDAVAARYGKLFAAVARKWQRKVAEADRTDAPRPAALDDETEDEIRGLFFADGPLDLTEDELANRLGEEQKKQFDALKAAIGDWANGPNAVPHARVLIDADQPEEPAVFVRGDPGQRGDAVPRQFLAVLAGPGRKPFADGTGRLELAQAVADPKNPLTARVWANRVWGHLLGRPIVETASDFGLRSAPPTHPALLDFLADSLVANGWSTKRLVRRVVLSSTYQQSSHAATPADPRNTLLGRANRKRLELEPLRDSLLAAGGALDPAVGGRPAGEPDASSRRTLYLPVDRGNLSDLYRTFDFANPDLSSPGRYETTVPQQGLFLLNSPFVQGLARKLSARAGGLGPAGDAAWVKAAYRAALSRDPTAEEAARAAQFLASAAKVKSVGPSPRMTVWRYGYGKWDAAAKTLTGFTALDGFEDDQWRAAKVPPDAQSGYPRLGAEGGVPGDTPERCAVRRWVAPADGVLTADGVITHSLPEGVKPEECDGLRAWVVSSRGGLLAEAEVNRSTGKTNATLAVKAGDAIDFVADPKGNGAYDDFTWKVSLTLKVGPKEVGFDSADDFRGPPPAPAPPLSPREKFAHVLLMTAEFAFVD